MRLSQLQDIGGLRIIVPRNRDVDALLRFLQEKFQTQTDVVLSRVTDYRDRGRDRTGYRSLHVLLERDDRALELQDSQPYAACMG